MKGINALSIILTVVVAAIGIYQTRQVSRLRSQIQALQEVETASAGKIEQLSRERDEAAIENRWFFLLALPVGWAALSLLHFQFPGDEYGLWAVSSMAGTWSLFLLPNIGDIHQPWIRLCVAGVGALVMAGVGWGLWRLGVRKRLWVPVWLAASAILLFWALQSYPSLERALAKNGSWTAYILSSLLLGMYAAALVSAAGRSVWWAVNWRRR